MGFEGIMNSAFVEVFLNRKQAEYRERDFRTKTTNLILRTVSHPFEGFIAFQVKGLARGSCC